jgi:cytochrome P450
MIARLEPDVAALTNKMCDKILMRQGQKEPLDVTVAYSNLTTDVISGYCFGEAFGLLDQ